MNKERRLHMMRKRAVAELERDAASKEMRRHLLHRRHEWVQCSCMSGLQIVSKRKKPYINNTHPYDISPETHRSKVRCDKGKWHIPPQHPLCLVHFLGTCFLGKGAQFEKKLRLFPFFRLTKIKSRHTLNFTYIQYTHNTNGKDGFIHEDPR